MSKCINTASAEFKSLTEMSGISSIELAAKMNLWMEENNTDVWPSLEQLRISNKLIKEGVDFVFDQNPELANSVYEALGFTGNIIQDNKSYYRGQIEQPTIDKNGNLVLYAKEDELYKRAGLKSKGVSMTDNLKSAIDYGNGQLEVARNLASESYDAEQELDRLLENGYYLIQVPKDISNEVVKEAGEVKIVGDKIIIPKGQYRIEQVIDGVESEITPQQKQQVQQLYSQYLDTIFPDSKVKDIVWRNDDSEKNVLDTKSPNKAGQYRGRFFGTYEEVQYHGGQTRIMFPILLNITKPYNTDSSKKLDYFYTEDVNKIKQSNDGIVSIKYDTKQPYEYVVFEPEQIHILGSKQDIEGFKKFVEENKIESKEISETETVEDSYMANFDPDGEFNFSEYDDILKQIDQDESEFDLNEDIFSKDEKKESLNLSFANLTKTLIYQHNDVKNELQNLYGQLNDAKAKDRPAIKSKIAKINQKRQELVDKIKESKKLSNLEQLLQFGNDAINEVSQILSEGGLTDKQLNYLKRITDFWMRAGDFKSSQFDHILFGKDYETKINESIEDGLVAIAERMKKLDREVNSIGREFIVRMVKKQLGNTYTEADIYKAIKDINWGEANLFSISDYSSPLLSAVYAVMHDADKKAAWEFEELIKQLDDKFKAAERHLSGKGNNKYDLFYQSHNGQLTGDLVGVYSKAYLDKKAELIEKAQRSKKPEDWKAFKDWSKENETYIDIRLLFPEGELSAEQTEVAKAHIKSIIDKIGQRQFDRIYRQLENAIEDYNYAKVQKMTTINSNLESTESQKWEELSAWEHRMSPYIELDRRLGVLNPDGTYGSTDVRFHNQISYADKGIRGLRSIPKAKINGKSSGWYDSKYEQISKNKELLDLYEYIQDTMDYMRSILPEHLRNHVGSNTMPMIMKSITELYKQNSAIGMANLWNSIQKSFVVNESSETEFNEIDVNTGVEVGGLKPRTFMYSDRIISERMKIKQSEFLAKNGVEPTKEDDINLRKEVIDQLNLERSFDLPKVMKIYIHSLISHKHKSNVDDLIKIARRELDSISEISVSEAGVDQFTPEGKLRTQVGLKRMKESLDYAIKAFESGQLHTPEGRSSTKTLSYLEKKELAELLATKDKLQIQFDNGKINEAQLAKNNKVIDDKIARLGGYVALSKIGDNLLKYTQLKGMGFNIIAGGVNLLTGWMENSIRAADGRWFNETQLNQSLRDAYTTIFDPTRKSKNTKKLINIEKRFHLVEDASQELYKEENRFGEIVYVIVKKTEFLNVMSMAGAFMRNIQVTNDKGEKSNLYEAFDENGNIKSGWKLSETKSNEDFLLDVDLRMLKLKHKIHGNYGDRLKGKENILGRMAFQFRTWMPEMYNARFGKRGFDDILQKEVRGRWLSIGKIIKGSEFEGNQFTAADNILYTLGQLGRKILFMRTSFDGRMSEMDAANMKANLMELHFMLGLMALMLILKAAVPDEEKKKNFSYNFLINMIIRQQNDIMVFANPMTFEQINKNVLPVMSILTDTDALITSIKNEFSDDDRKTGKSLGKLAKMLPPLGQAVRIVQYGEKQIAQQ